VDASMRPTMWLGALVLAMVATTVTACGDDDDERVESNPVATFEVSGGETYRIELATPELVDHVRHLIAGEQVAAIPNGAVVRSAPGVNEPWSWHIDPATLEFADATIEVCDGLPSDVEAGSITSDRFCPWSAKVVSIDE
jgi:hypothetical protein